MSPPAPAQHRKGQHDCALPEDRRQTQPSTTDCRVGILRRKQGMAARSKAPCIALATGIGLTRAFTPFSAREERREREREREREEGILASKHGGTKSRLGLNSTPAKSSRVRVGRQRTARSQSIPHPALAQKMPPRHKWAKCSARGVTTDFQGRQATLESPERHEL